MSPGGLGARAQVRGQPRQETPVLSSEEARKLLDSMKVIL
jgi:hypothetical protein